MNEEPSLFDSQSSVSSQEHLSQISSWSDDMDTSLDDINNSLQIISHGSISPLKFQLRTDLEKLQESSRRAVKRKAKTAVHAILNCIAPGQGEKLLKLIQDQPLHSDQDTECDDLLNLILILFQESSNTHSKRLLLSMIAHKFTKKQLQDMIPGLTVYCIDQARLHASENGRGTQVPVKKESFRQRLNQEKLEHALDFFFNPTFNQVCSFGTKEMRLQSGEVVTIPEVVRTVCHATLINTYEAFCKETEFTPLSNSTLYHILQSCPASRRTNLKGLEFQCLFTIRDVMKI